MSPKELLTRQDLDKIKELSNELKSSGYAQIKGTGVEIFLQKTPENDEYFGMVCTIEAALHHLYLKGYKIIKEENDSKTSQD